MTRTLHLTRHAASSFGAFALAAVFLLSAPLDTVAAEATTKTWSGTWDNRKYKTSGPLKCTATTKDSSSWQAKFTGEGLGKPFGYDATIKITNRGGRLVLSGTTSVDGEAYQWSGYVQGNYLVGSYRSASGNNGSFKLQESR
jgi:hypothetical protein